MRDLTEALLIEMERRADHLATAFEEDPDGMSRHDLWDAYEHARSVATDIATDVTELCAQIRAKATA